MQTGFQVIIWVICISTSLLLSLEEDRWKYRILQMACNACILLCVFGMALHQGYAIYSSMSLQNERLLRNSMDKSKMPTSDSLPNEARREVAKRLLKVLVCGTAVIFPTVFFQVVEAAGLIFLLFSKKLIRNSQVSLCASPENAKNRYTNDASNPRPPPSSVLSYSAFEIFQFVGCLVLLFIFHKVSPQQKSQPEQVAVSRREFDSSPFGSNHNQKMTLDSPIIRGGMAGRNSDSSWGATATL